MMDDKFCRVILTHRPLSFKKPVSAVNALTRWIFGHPRDHIAIHRENYIYESTFRIPKSHRPDGRKSGAHKMLYTIWKSYRKGTDILVYIVPERDLDWELLEEFIGKPYDTKSAIFHFMQKINPEGKWEERMKNKKDRAITCSEYFAIGAHMPEAHSASPEDCDNWLRSKNYQSFNDTL